MSRVYSGLVDQDAIVKALQTNEIWAAGLDVMTPEPLPEDHILTTLPNCSESEQDYYVFKLVILCTYERITRPRQMGAGFFLLVLRKFVILIC